MVWLIRNLWLVHVPINFAKIHAMLESNNWQMLSMKYKLLKAMFIGSDPNKKKKVMWSSIYYILEMSVSMLLKYSDQ